MAEINALRSHITAQVDRSSLTLRERLLRRAPSHWSVEVSFFGGGGGATCGLQKQHISTANQYGLNNKATPRRCLNSNSGVTGWLILHFLFLLKERKRAGPLWLCACHSWRGGSDPSPSPPWQSRCETAVTQRRWQHNLSRGTR